MHIKSHHLWALLTILAFGISTHLTPHEWGVTTIGTASLLAAAYLPRRAISIAVLVPVLLGDIMLGLYPLLAMAIVYLAHVLAAYGVTPILKKVRVKTVFIAALINAILFYLVSNLAPIAMGYYPNNLGGWIECYVNGLPFLWRGLLANLIFGGFAFSCIYLAKEFLRAARFTSAQRD